jgi:hypothetical protein
VGVATVSLVQKRTHEYGRGTGFSGDVIEISQGQGSIRPASLGDRVWGGRMEVQ